MSRKIQTVLCFSVVLLACGESPPSEQAETGTLVNSPNGAAAPVFITTPPEQTHETFAYFEFESDSAASHECQMNTGDIFPCASGTTVVANQSGEQTFSVWALNSEGQRSDAEIFKWTITSIFGSAGGSVAHADLIVTEVSPTPVDDDSWRGIFRINCDFSHASYDDPIVYPGQQDAAHLHRFYGNTHVDHTTTMETLYSQGDSSCQGNVLNRSAYWVPALLAPTYNDETGEREYDEEGEALWQVVPAVVGDDNEAHEIFYYSAAIERLEDIQPIPAGLRMIAGDHQAKPGAEQDTAIVRWHCQSWGSDDATNPRFSASIPICEAPDRVRLDIFFPSCWNGTDLDSDDHKSHMAYPVGGGGTGGPNCPDSHPIPIVRPSYHYAFGVKPEVYEPVSRTSRGWRLASDMYDSEVNSQGGMSLHGDWFNGWHPEVMQALLDNCIIKQLDCHDGNLANGYRLSGTRPGSQTEPRIYNKGMGK